MFKQKLLEFKRREQEASPEEIDDLMSQTETLMKYIDTALAAFFRSEGGEDKPGPATRTFIKEVLKLILAGEGLKIRDIDKLESNYHDRMFSLISKMVRARRQEEDLRGHVFSDSEVIAKAEGIKNGAKAGAFIERSQPPEKL